MKLEFPKDNLDLGTRLFRNNLEITNNGGWLKRMFANGQIARFFYKRWNLFFK